MSDERCPTCGQYVQVETTGEGTSRFVPVAVEDGGYWEDRATAAEAEVERLRRLVLRDHAQGHRAHADCPACQKFGYVPTDPGRRRDRG